MIKLVKYIPAQYERVALEEYYEFFQFQNGLKDILNKKNKFTLDENKLDFPDYRNKSLMDAINTLRSNDENFSFLIVLDDFDRLIAISRICIKEDYIHACEIIYTNYPTDYEKVDILNQITAYIEEVALLNDFKIDIELPVYDDLAIMYFRVYGYRLLPDDNLGFKTVILNKDKIEREVDEPTLSRKQTKEFN